MIHITAPTPKKIPRLVQQALKVLRDQGVCVLLNADLERDSKGVLWVKGKRGVKMMIVDSCDLYSKV